MSKSIKEKLYAVVDSRGHIVRVPGGPLAVASTKKNSMSLACWSKPFHEPQADWKVVELVEKEVRNG